MIHSFEEAKLDQIFFRQPHPFGRRELAELIWLVSHRNILASWPGSRRSASTGCASRIWCAIRKRSCAELCAFLGIDYHPDMADPYKEKQARMTDGLHAESRMLGDVKFHRAPGVDASSGGALAGGRTRRTSSARRPGSSARRLGYDGEAAGRLEAWAPIEPAG